MRWRESRQPTYLGYLVPGFTIVFVTVVGALGWNGWHSLTRWAGVGDPEFIGLNNYRYILSSEIFHRAVLHDLWFLIPMCLIPTTLGMFVAAVIADYLAPRFGQGIASFLRGALFLTFILPMSISGQLWQWILDAKHGILNEALTALGCASCTRAWLDDGRLTQIALAVVMVWLQLGFAVIIYMAGMARIDRSVYEAAELDGAGWFSQFRHITVALVAPEFAAVLVVTLVLGLKVFAPIYWITDGGPLDASTVPALFSFHAFLGGGLIGYGAAVASIMTLVMTAVAIIAMVGYRRWRRLP